VPILSQLEKRNKVKLHRSAKKLANANQMEANNTRVCNKLHSGECRNKNKTNGKQQGQANKAFKYRTFNKPPQQYTYSIAEINKK
jgi:hypothetical protein